MSTNLTRDEAREIELAKYERAYNQTDKLYTMNARRFKDASRFIEQLPCRGSLLDVSCGYGDIIKFARRIGFRRVCGTETQEQLLRGNVFYALAHELPFNDDFYEVVTMFDTIEHLLHGDDEEAIKEMCRVATKFVIVSANNGPSYNSAGDDLHINKRPFDEWHELFKKWSSSKVIYLGCPEQDKNPRFLKSPAWRIEL